MCNPRQVRVLATRELAEAWEQEIRRVATRRDQIVGEARIRERLGASVGAPALAALEMALASADGWQFDGDTYRHELPGGRVVYHLDRQELEIVAFATDELDVRGEASTVVAGEVAEQLSSEGVGRYYDDGWGGHTREAAEQIADRLAQDELAAQRDALLERARQELEARHGSALEAEAAARADVEFARLAAQRAAELRRDAQARLTAIGIQGRNLFHQVLADAYRDAILAYARSRGADNIACSEQDGVLEIEFELEA